MLKPIFILTICLFFCREVIAQKRDTSVYYLKNSGKVVSSKDSADFFLVILPPDTSVDSHLFIVKEYYKNGKVRLMGNSRTNDLNLKFQGSQITFFPNGRKMRISNFEDGEPVGDVIEYYPNGKFYNSKSYIKNSNGNKEIVLNDCKDSTGNVLAVNGNGKWIKFNDKFNIALEKGQVINGLEEGEWQCLNNDSLGYTCVYKNGKIISRKGINYKGTVNQVYVKQDPRFPGGPDAFERFINKHIRYPNAAKKNGTEGEVTIGFVVEKDGNLSNLEVATGIGDGCDEEAIRVIKLSSPWIPAIRDHEAVAMEYSVAISFHLAKLSYKISGH
jgi:TonB family protein